MSLVSIIMPAFNAENWILPAVQSACAQTHEDLEIIVIDDGSTDETADAVSSIQDKRIRLIRQTNAGQSAAANLGLENARGEYIKFLDADDALSPNHIQSQLDALQKDNSKIADCAWGYFVEDWHNASPREESTNRDYEDPLEWLVESLSQNEGMMGGWKWLIPQAVIERAGGWNPKLGLNNDFDFSIRLLLASTGVKWAPDALYAYRKTTTTSLSGSRSRKAMESAYLTTMLGCNQLLARENSERIRRLCANRYQMWLFQFFPEYPDLAQKAEKAVTSLGGSDLSLQGGRALKLLMPTLGWKNIRRMQTFAYRNGWSSILKRKEQARVNELEAR
ncbi:glycosyltransferase family 2 protein [Cerasicoccus maritimus]|uniref:glycosyltransferase family 2 protein n=1 Tax=Cerasicoccus maritimus TaxID=490089 RepID=UPI002852D909|nr:glycosyltransferase family 2 protein [Cerasicoccus maritimus]